MSFLIERYFQILDHHELYEKVSCGEALAYFAERYVICAWSSSALLRSIQKELVVQSMPLNSESLKLALRLVTEMVLKEEVEELGDGSFQSHMEIFLEAMRDLNCDISSVFLFFDLLAQEEDIEEIFSLTSFPEEVEKYARQTLSILNMPIHVRASALFYEGEPFIPDKFLINLWKIKDHLKVEKLIEYFERHIEGLKRDEYSLSGRLVEVLCSSDQMLTFEADRIAECVMKNKINLWDSMVDGMKQPLNAHVIAPLRHLRVVK